MSDLAEALRDATDALEQYDMVEAANPPFVEDWAGLAHTMARALKALAEAAQEPVKYEYGMDSLWGNYILPVRNTCEAEHLNYVRAWEGRRAYRRVVGTEQWEELR